MNMRIEPYAPHHLAAVVRLSLRAWAPVFDSMQEALGPEVFLELYPDWPTNQQKAVEDVCAEDGVHVVGGH
jgi:hypothetical protein